MWAADGGHFHVSSERRDVLVEGANTPYDLRMSEAIAFDTHRFVKRLTDCGFTEMQAETLADEHVTLLNSNLATKTDVAKIEAQIESAQLATKTDLAKIEAQIESVQLATKTDLAEIEAQIESAQLAAKADIARVEAQIESVRLATKADIAEIGAQIESVKSDLLKWLFGALIAQGGLIVALVKLL